MLGLKLREEFAGRRQKGTQIELTTGNNDGATQVAADEFLKITYPTGDVLKTIEAAGPGQGRALVIRGERGLGKSHLMATLHHALTDQTATQKWLEGWASLLGNEALSAIPLRAGMHVISGSLHRQRHKHLWDVLFELHPHGAYVRGKWEALGTSKTDVPSDALLLEMFRHTPTALILDEFQTWYDSLRDTRQQPQRAWAFNFVQLLSEIAKEHPELLVLVVSVRNGSSDAFQQIQRVNPVIIDFKGPSARHDRLRLLLHRLFENRLQIDRTQIAASIAAHVNEYFRLCDVAAADQDAARTEFLEAWPFAPHLMRLLEDQVLMATAAQETRDLIRVLADLFKHRAKDAPLLTAADFRLDDESSGIAALLDSVANQHHAKLREKALRNLDAVRAAVPDVERTLPHLSSVVGSLWLRSLADVNQAGADRATLHVDVTRGTTINDNTFQVELETIRENSFNIHEVAGGRLVFREEENPQAKLLASARNDKLFPAGEDTEHLAREVRYVLAGGGDVASRFRVVVLPRAWKVDPWAKLDEADQPARWGDRIPVVVLPEPPIKPAAELGRWLRDHVPVARNTVRFLLPREGTANVFADRDLLVLARCVHLAGQWKANGPDYARLESKYQKELRDSLKIRFDRFAVLANWNFQQPDQCRFHIEPHQAQGAKIPDAMDEHIRDNLFIPEEFRDVILAAAAGNDDLGKLLRELKEPRPGGQDCIPWLGETLVKDHITRLCAAGDIAVNLRGMDYLQRHEGEDTDAAWKRLRGKIGSGKHLDETHVLLPQNVPVTSGGPSLFPSGTMTGTPNGPTVGPTIVAPAGVGPSGVGNGTPQPPAPPVAPGVIFNGGAASFATVSIPATSALNLLGRIESSGIKAGSQLQSLRLQVEKLTGAQLQELLRKLPDGMTFALDVEQEKPQ